MTEVSPEWTAELKMGSIQLCLLALLKKEEKYGFQILHELRDRSNGFFDLKEGTLYPALRRLEERGFVQSRWQEPTSGMPRKYYRLTDRGRTALREALAVWDAMTQGAERVLARHPLGASPRHWAGDGIPVHALDRLRRCGRGMDSMGRRRCGNPGRDRGRRCGNGRADLRLWRRSLPGVRSHHERRGPGIACCGV